MTVDEFNAYMANARIQLAREHALDDIWRTTLDIPLGFHQQFFDFTMLVTGQCNVGVGALWKGRAPRLGAHGTRFGPISGNVRGDKHNLPYSHPDGRRRVEEVRTMGTGRNNAPSSLIRTHSLFVSEPGGAGMQICATEHTGHLAIVREFITDRYYTALDAACFEVRRQGSATAQRLSFVTLINQPAVRTVFARWVACFVAFEKLVGGADWMGQNVPVYLNTKFESCAHFFRNLRHI